MLRFLFLHPNDINLWSLKAINLDNYILVAFLGLMSEREIYVFSARDLIIIIEPDIMLQNNN